MILTAMAILMFMCPMILMKAIIYISIKKTALLKMNWKNALHIQAFLPWVQILLILTMMVTLKYLPLICCLVMIIGLKTLGAFDNIDLYQKKIKSGFYHQYMKNCLQLNNGNGTFSEIGNYSGVSATDWSWGALMFDADNDGLNDIYVCNGVNRDVTNLDFMDFFANDVIQKMVLTGKKDNVDEVLTAYS